MNKKIWALIAIAAVLAMSALRLSVGDAATRVAAVDGICGSQDTGFYMGETTLSGDTYDVYVKLGRPGQTASVGGYIRSSSNESSCWQIGTVKASGDRWQKIGSYRHDTPSETMTMQLASPVLANLPDANRPSILLVSQTNPACVPSVECETTIGGEKAYIRPGSNSLDDNSLRIVVAGDTAKDSVLKVQYYVDSELMYETDALEDFDMWYVPYYGTTMTRTIQYASGQTVVLQSAVPEGHVDSPLAIAVRPFRKYQNTAMIIVLVLVLIIVAGIVRMAVRYLYKRRMWRLNHGFAQDRSISLKAEDLKLRRIKYTLIRAYNIFERVVVFGAIAIVLVIVPSMYVGQIAHVDGESMMTSYQDNQTLFVNKLPVTLARINNTAYIPKRGDVVIAHPSYGASTDTSSGEMIIKRAIGLPGDKIIIKNGMITVYNDEHPEGFSPETGTEWAEHIQRDSDLTSEISIQLAEDEVFVVGDNRPVSIDSRYNGPIKVNQIVGVVL